MSELVIPPVEQRPEWVREFAEPADLDAEPSETKALRMLDMLRAFLAADERVMLMTLDGRPIVFLKPNVTSMAEEQPVDGVM